MLSTKPLRAIRCAVIAAHLAAFCMAAAFSRSALLGADLYPRNRPPLIESTLVELPLGAVKPRGWLLDQLRIQAAGLTGHLEEFWKDLGPSTAWKGGDGEGWERGPYYLDGLVPLAYLLDDARLLGLVKPWIEWMLASQQPNGWFGPAKNKDRWPLSVALKVLTQYHEASGDPRVIPFLEGYCRYLRENPPDWPDKEWRGVRAMENAVSIYWLHRRTGDPSLLETTRSIFENSFSWTRYSLDFPYPADVLAKGIASNHLSHNVNIAMAVKYSGLYYQQSKDATHRNAVFKLLENLDAHHGQVTGIFGGDEHLSGPRPTQGTELCGVVECMFSLECLLAALAHAPLADRLESLAYNALPGTCTPDLWAHQYDQQANQVLCTVAKRRWSTNGDDSNIYGLEPNYGCCTANLHQGWPKLVTHLWMATAGNGLAAVAYGPSVVEARVGPRGDLVRVTETTEYPFDGTVELSFQLERPVAFELYLRVPSWARGARLTIQGTEKGIGPPGDFFVLGKEWKNGDRLQIQFPMNLRAETRYNGAASVRRGPLVFSLRIGERFEKIRGEAPHADWAVHPTTPWNYGLLLDREHPERSLTVERKPIGHVPFENSAAPVVLRARGRLLPSWSLEDHSAGETPKSPVESSEPLADLELVPYGSTRLRITEFPTLKE